MSDHPIPTKDEIQQVLTEGRNWGRWGDDDGVGAINLITPAKRLQATALVQTGRTVSMSRLFPKNPGPLNPVPAQHFIKSFDRGSGGAVIDFYGVAYHGFATTHIDALCHVWDEHGAWNGRDPKSFITTDGVTFADITNWQSGIITRGVLIDVPAHRNTPHVTIDQPVHGWELEEIAAAQGVELGPGDALIVYSGREHYQAENPTAYMGDTPSPGLHASCAKFIRDHDVSLLGWDMMDAKPNDYDMPWPVHSVLFSFGVALMDNALLQPLAEACREENRWEFLFMLLPLPVAGGTGSPANPIAMF